MTFQSFGSVPERPLFYVIIPSPKLILDSPAIFAAYFSEIIAHFNELRNQSTFSQYKKIWISRGRIFSFNSFTKRDVFIKVSYNGHCESAAINSSLDATIPVNGKCWRQLKISTLLRFFRASQPIHNFFFGTKSEPCNCLVAKSGGRFSFDDLIFIAENHTNSDELQIALSFGLLTSLNSSQIIDFVQQYDIKYSNLISYLARIISPAG